jgi:hypothetical protein
MGGFLDMGLNFHNDVLSSLALDHKSWLKTKTADDARVNRDPTGLAR